MDTHELARLEQDLAAVERRLASARTWDATAPRVRRRLRRPTWSLLWTSTLIAVCIPAGFIAPNAWLTGVGLALFVLPKRVRAHRERRAALALVSEGDLFALYRHELTRRMAGHVLDTFFQGALIVLFLIVAAFAPDSRPGLVVAGILAAWVAIDLLWALPRTARAIAALEEGEAEA